METNRGPDIPAESVADVIHQQIGALTDASIQRHRLVPGSAEYQAALEVEETLAEHVWQLASDHGPDGREPEAR